MSRRAKAGLVPRGAAGFSFRMSVKAPRERVFDAFATLKGLRSWWTPIVGGSPKTGGQLRFEFKGMDECIIMRVDRAEGPASIRWTCLMHSGLPEWNDTVVAIDLRERTPKTCELAFRHVGLTPRLSCYSDCRRGWEHFLASAAGYVERGEGTPFGGRAGG